MSSAAQPITIPHADVQRLRDAREIVLQEAGGLQQLANALDTRFSQAVDLIVATEGTVIVSGLGKAGLIGQKIAATLSSTGTRAYFLHPTEAAHGDLGCVHSTDVVLAISNSGETAEVCDLLPRLARLGAKVIAITSTDENTLAKNADIALTIGKHSEAGPYGLAPTTSTTAMLALGDALALVVASAKGFSPEQFAVFHPGGSLGRKLSIVHEVMRPTENMRIASEDLTIREILTHISLPGRRTGAIVLVDGNGLLSGIFTDSDLARLLEQRRDDQLDRPISEVMTRQPKTIHSNAMLSDAVEQLSQNKVSELPVVDDAGQPVGLIDITDVIGLMPG